MKKIIILLVSLFILAACANRSEQPAEDMKDFLAPYLKDSCSSILKREYNEEKEMVEVSYESKKWEVWNSVFVGYDVTGKDILGIKLQKPHVSNFHIGVWFIKRGATDVSSLEVKMKDKKYVIAPILVQPMKETSGYFLTYYDFAEKQSLECLDRLSRSYDYVEMKIVTDKGKFTIPLSEIYKIQYMARAYREDGGRFE